MADKLIALLAQRGQTLSAAESVTGGLIADLIVRTPGASRVFCGSGVTYTDTAKQRVLGVRPGTLARFTAVSRRAALEMAEGAKALYATDYALSSTGYAGPFDRETGLCYIGLSGPGGSVVYSLRFRGARNGIRQAAAACALYLLYQHLKGIDSHGIEK